MSSFSQWQSRDYPAGDAPFRVAETGGPQPVFHDRLDALRSMWRRTPDAEYPDGYVGTVQTKRRDRLRAEEAQRATNKPYNRGVHKGERLNQDDYFWPPEMQPTDGMKYQMSGMRFVPPGVLMDIGAIPQTRPDPSQPYLARVAARGTPGRVGTAEWGKVDPDRATTLKRLAPPWGGGPGPGMAVPYPGR
jgi:hypothetical protein